MTHPNKWVIPTVKIPKDILAQVCQIARIWNSEFHVKVFLKVRQWRITRYKKMKKIDHLIFSVGDLRFPRYSHGNLQVSYLRWPKITISRSTLIQRTTSFFRLNSGISSEITHELTFSNSERLILKGIENDEKWY